MRHFGKIPAYVSPVIALWIAALLVAGCKKSFDATGEVVANEKKVLNLYSWSEYFPRPVLDEFTKSTGIKVNLATYSTNEELIDKLTSGVSDYDVVVPSDYAVRILILDKRLLPLDRARIPTFTNLDPKQLGLPFDNETRYTVPYLRGT